RLHRRRRRTLGLVRGVRPRGACAALGHHADAAAVDPAVTNELRQLWETAGFPPIPDIADGKHHALADARLALDRYRAIVAAGS
ncbi:hypothetical protein QUT07_22460, partial [Xanthomonas citri pv. citri]